MTEKNIYQQSYVYPTAPAMNERDTALYPRIYTTETQQLPPTYATFNSYPYRSQPSIIYINPRDCHHRHRDDCQDDCYCCTIV